MSHALKRIESQKIVLMFDFIMWGIAASLLKLVPDDTCKTCYTDAEVLGFNPAFIDNISDPELLFVLSHEVLHVLLGHCFRVNGKDLDDWNAACDYVVNLILVDLGLKAPESILLDEKYRGMSAEEVYYFLRKDRDQQHQKRSQQKQSTQGQGSGQNSPKPSQSHSQNQEKGNKQISSSSSAHSGTNEDDCANSVPDGSVLARSEQAGDQSEAEESAESRRGFGEIRANDNRDLEKQWQYQAVIAAAQAKQRGQLSGSLRRIIVDANSLEIDFVGLSYLFVQKLDASDYTWTRPNRNYLPQGIYVPSLHTKRLGPMFFGNDASGSISDFQQACSQKLLINLMNDTRPESLTVIHFDAKVQKVETFEEFDDISISPVGGGGTDFRPVFEEISKSDIEPAGLIILTDLEGEFPNKEPDYPVLWISTTPNRKAPFGETVFLDLRSA